MGLGTAMANFLGAYSSPGCDRNSESILRRELTLYISTIQAELTSFGMLRDDDKKALGDMFKHRTEGLEAAMKATQEMVHGFLTRGESVRKIVTLDRVQEGSCASMGYCNMHDLLIQMVRDWGSDNDNVRRSQHEVVLEVIRAEAEKKGPKLGRVLVPGDALCRMSWDLASLGYFDEVEAVEASPLFADMAVYLLNNVQKPFSLYPHAGVFSNQETVRDHLRKVVVPTPHPNSPLPCGSIQLRLGSFEELYAASGKCHRSFDCIVTCFFLDTVSKSVIGAVETISSLLSPGGLWVNLGPLLYRGDARPKLSWEELEVVIQRRGFTVERSERISFAEYCEKAETSMHPTIYSPRLLVARKGM